MGPKNSNALLMRRRAFELKMSREEEKRKEEQVIEHELRKLSLYCIVLYLYIYIALPARTPIRSAPSEKDP